MEIRPLKDRVLVIRDVPEKVTASGIVIPETGIDRPDNGTVISIGNAVSDVSVGDRIVFSKYAGQVVTVDGVESIIMRTEEILAVFE